MGDKTYFELNDSH